MQPAQPGGPWSAPGFAQPLVTWAENQLIAAEAAYCTGDEATARTRLNEVRAANMLPAVSLSGPALLEAVMIEKWIAQFQNIDAWNDYKRTCVPNVAPAGGAAAIPGRLLYAFTERNTNPNIPPPEQQPLRNDNDPANATTPTGATCLGQQ